MVLGTINFRGDKVEISTDKYRHGGGLCVRGESLMGPYVFSMNLYGHPSTDVCSLGKYEFVLSHDILNIPGAEKELMDSGLFEDTGQRCGYGYCSNVPIWRVK